MRKIEQQKEAFLTGCGISQDIIKKKKPAPKI